MTFLNSATNEDRITALEKLQKREVEEVTIISPTVESALGSFFLFILVGAFIVWKSRKPKG